MLRKEKNQTPCKNILRLRMLIIIVTSGVRAMNTTWCCGQHAILNQSCASWVNALHFFFKEKRSMDLLLYYTRCYSFQEQKLSFIFFLLDHMWWHRENMFLFTHFIKFLEQLFNNQYCAFTCERSVEQPLFTLIIIIETLSFLFTKIWILYCKARVIIEIKKNMIKGS